MLLKPQSASCCLVIASAKTDRQTLLSLTMRTCTTVDVFSSSSFCAAQGVDLHVMFQAVITTEQYLHGIGFGDDATTKVSQTQTDVLHSAGQKDFASDLLCIHCQT